MSSGMDAGGELVGPIIAQSDLVFPQALSDLSDLAAFLNSPYTFLPQHFLINESLRAHSREPSRQLTFVSLRPRLWGALGLAHEEECDPDHKEN